MFSRTLSTILGLVVTSGLPAAEEPSITLSGVPEQIDLPLSKGKNQVIDVFVTGGSVREVWIARTRESRLRLALTGSSELGYQVNLADPDVAALLIGSGPREFRVFAELESGKVVESIPVAYRVPPISTRAPTCHVHVGANGERIAVDWSRRWFETSEVRDVEVSSDGDPIGPIRVRAGEVTLPFELGDDDTHRLAMSPRLEDLWRGQGSISVEQRNPTTGDWRQLCRLHARPARLAFGGNTVPLTIKQRRSAIVPGSNEYVSVQLSDVTAGQVFVTIRGADHRVLVATTSLRQGDHVRLRLTDEEYTILVRRLVNVLIGEDWAVIDVSRLPPEALSRIERLLAHVAASEVVFIREEKEYSGRDAADHLRKKLGASDLTVTSVDVFIEELASRSSITGKPYSIRLPDGATLTAREWLEQEARALDTIDEGGQSEDTSESDDGR